MVSFRSPQMWNRFCVFLPWCVSHSCWLQSGLVYLIRAEVFESNWCIAHPMGKPAMVVVRVQGAPREETFQQQYLKVTRDRAIILSAAVLRPEVGITRNPAWAVRGHVTPCVPRDA